tara:strand:- start:198 stop:443 length:246 start_codon:yes stop_codon:yes gene_type:complete
MKVHLNYHEIKNLIILIRENRLNDQAYVSIKKEVLEPTRIKLMTAKNKCEDRYSKTTEYNRLKNKLKDLVKPIGDETTWPS